MVRKILDKNSKFISDNLVSITSFIEEMTEQDFLDNGTIEGRLDTLYSYIVDRVYADDPNDFEDEIERLNPLLMGLKALGYIGDGSMDLEDSSYLLERFISKYYLLHRLDFGGEGERYSLEGDTPFTLKELSFLSGLAIDSVRNYASKKGIKGLATESHKNITSREGERLIETTFVCREEAIRWLTQIGRYTPAHRLVSAGKGHIEQLDAHICAAVSEYEGPSLPSFLELKTQGSLQTFYAPFDTVNQLAKVVFCGITPGLYQAQIALQCYAQARLNLHSIEDAEAIAKEAASFSGPMRANLIKLLNYIRLDKWLGIDDCIELFNGKKHLVHYTSALRYPVFSKGENYSGSPNMLKKESLKWQIDKYLADELRQLNDDTIIIPLGPKVDEVLQYLAKEKIIAQEQILTGLPHPSGANGERIAYFCEEKARDDLSTRTNADRLDSARENIRSKLSRENN